MVPVPHHPSDFEFSCRGLCEQIVRSAVTHDPVRLQRAITAAIDLHGGAAERAVFAPARLAAADVGPACAALVTRAIDTYVHARRAA
jgi:hypothetical protein